MRRYGTNSRTSRHRHSIVLSMCLLLLCTMAQSKASAVDSLTQWKAGIGAGLSFNNHVCSLNAMPDVPSCAPLMTKGSGSALFLSGFWAVPITERLMFSAGLGYRNLDGLLSVTQSQLIDDNGMRMATIEYSVQTKVSCIELCPELRYQLGPVSILGGLRVGLYPNATYEQQELIQSPSNVVFENDRRDRMNFSGDITRLSSTELSASIGLSTSFQLGSAGAWSVEPRVSYVAMMSNMLNTPDPWSVHAVCLGVSLVYTKQREEVVVVPPVIAPVPEPKKLPEPIAQAPKLKKKLFKGPYIATLRDSNNLAIGQQLNVINTISQNTYAMINYVFFDSASATIPNRYRVLSSSEAAQFKTTELNATSTMQIYYNILNLIGHRMREDLKTRIVLVGCNSGDGSEKNNMSLSKDRAESVKRYLTSVWSVDPARISVNARNLPESPSSSTSQDGAQENRRVEIRTESSELLEPLIFSDTVCTINAKTLGFPGTIEPSIQVSSWSLSIRNNDKTVASMGDQGPLPAEIKWDTDIDRESIQRAHGSLRAVLKVVDTEGEHYEVESEAISIKQQRVRNSTIQRFSLITFAYNTSTMSKSDRSIINIIKKNISPKSIVHVTGYTDRVGDLEYNRQLSEQRAQQVARVLHAPLENARGEGAENQLYDNATPEGRFYSRTVIVTIETPFD